MLCPNCHDDIESSCRGCGWVDVEGFEEAETLSEPQVLNELEKMFQYVGCPVTVQVSGATHIGKVKKRNEDYFLTVTLDSQEHQISTTIMVVADGIGGGAGGQAMAILAVLEIVKALVFSVENHEKANVTQSREEFWQSLNKQIAEDLVFPLRGANKLNYAYGQKQQFGRYGGAALGVVIAVCDYAKGHVRVHGYNDGDIHCLLIFNHSVHGLLSTDHCDADGALTAYCGGNQHEIRGSFFEPVDFWFPERLDVFAFTLLLYSDGFYKMLSEEMIAEFSELDSEDLVDLALTVQEPAGKLFDSRVATGDDNITVLKLEIQKRR